MLPSDTDSCMLKLQTAIQRIHATHASWREMEVDPSLNGEKGN